MPLVLAMEPMLTMAPRLHVCQRRLRHQKCAAQMHRQHAVKRICCLLQSGHGLVANACVVDQCIETALLCHHVRHGCRDLGFVGDVAQNAHVVMA